MNCLAQLAQITSRLNVYPVLADHPFLVRLVYKILAATPIIIAQVVDKEMDTFFWELLAINVESSINAFSVERITSMPVVFVRTDTISIKLTHVQLVQSSVYHA